MQSSANSREQAPPRINALARPDFLRGFARPNLPCILTEASRGWRARAWTLEWFREAHGEVRFPVGRSYSRVWTPTEMTLREYLDSVLRREGPQELYLASTAFLDRLPSLRDDFAFPDYTWWDLASNTLMFIGGTGARTPLHFDYSHTLLAQIAGRKRFRLFSPSQTERLDPLPRELYQTFSRLDVGPAGLVGSGAAAVTPEFDFTLAPGETLFLPYGWWHAVESLDPTISITRSWWTLRMALAEAPRLAADWARRCVPSADSQASASEGNPAPS